MTLSVAAPRILVALDYPDAETARAFVARVSPRACRLKVGKELFVSAGPAFVEELVDQGFSVFLDLKFHDIPNTVAAACKVAARLGVWMVNVHASGGPRMLAAAREALETVSGPRPILIGVTVLTSMGPAELNAIGISADPEAQVLRLASLAQTAGLDGVVCSAQEAEALRQACGPNFTLVTPGIRPAGSDQGDQTRIVTPAQAIQLGADYLVIGRPITQSADPLAALAAISAEIQPFVSTNSQGVSS